MITKVCIDDFALKKRESYGSIMVDIETHRVIDMIESRDCEDVIEWLKTYPNLQIVSRGGSITYKNAIDIAHPTVIQVSDRFHLLKNLTSYCKDYLMKMLSAKVIIDIDPHKEPNAIGLTYDTNISNKKLTLEEKMIKALQMVEYKSFIKKNEHQFFKIIPSFILPIFENKINSIYQYMQGSKNEYVKSTLTSILTYIARITIEYITIP